MMKKNVYLRGTFSNTKALGMENKSDLRRIDELRRTDKELSGSCEEIKVAQIREYHDQIQ
jgi:hypothetical protein